MVTVGSGSRKQYPVVTEVGVRAPCHPGARSLLGSVAGGAEGLSTALPDLRVLGDHQA